MHKAHKNSMFKRGMSVFLSLVMLLGMLTVPAAAAGTTWYVDPMGDDNADGTSAETAFLNISTAYAAAEDGDIIQLTGDFDLNTPIPEFNSNKSVTINGGGATITYTGDNIDTTSSGVFKVNAGDVTFENLTIDANMVATSHSGRALYAGQNARVTLNDVTLTNGQHVDRTLGGGAIYVHTGAEVLLTGSTTLEGNVSTYSGGAVFVADGGELTVQDSVSISGNEANEGGGIYVANGGVLKLTDNTNISGNTATNGGGLFLQQGSHSEISGDVAVSGNGDTNVYLQDTDSNEVTTDTSKIATLDISGATANADIGITCQNPNYYRLVSLPVGYDIDKSDEAGWTYDDGSYDIRLMTYEGVTGLFLYYHTIPVEYEGTENLKPDNGITGPDINKEIISYPSEIATDGDMGANTPSSGDYTLDVTVDDSFYRIPETVELTADGRTLVDGEDYVWTPNYEDGTGTIVISRDALETMQQAGETLNVKVVGDQYFTLTLNLSDVDIDLNGFFEVADNTSDPADAEISNTG